MSVALVCFDLDDTLVQHIHSVRLLSILHGQEASLLSIEELEDEGKLNLVEADRHKAKLLKGLAVDAVPSGFDMLMRPIDNIGETICRLREQDIHCLLMTAGPIQVARVASARWGFDGTIASQYEEQDGYFTGEITEHIAVAGKLHYLKDYIKDRDIALKDCVAVGDGGSDIELFQGCGHAIAVNASAEARACATFVIDTSNLFDILPVVAEMRTHQ